MNSHVLPKLALSLPDAAHSLGVSERTIRRLVEKGDLPSVRIGGRRLIRYTDLARLMDVNARQPLQEPASEAIADGAHPGCGVAA
jgi:excisionase family DNA binding protein